MQAGGLPAAAGSLRFNTGALRARAPRRGAAATRRQVATRAEDSSGGAGGERQGWDFGRFLRTVLFFNPPPPPQKVVAALLGAPAKALAALAGSEEGAGASAVTTLLPGTMASGAETGGGIVMVAGATGGVGRRVVAALLARGRAVRALVRDVPKAREMLAGLPVAGGGRLELAAADVTQRGTLSPELFAGVRSLVVCTAVKVAPKEGDSADRAKYYQGIKFFDPEIVGDTPETVEALGLANLMEAAAPHLPREAGLPVFTPDGAAPLAGWGALDDVVMGGASRSQLAIVPGEGEGGAPAAVFRGLVTSANNGGFASVRSVNAEPSLDLGAYGGLALRLLGDGQRYKLIVRDDPAWDGIGYTASFDTAAGEWQTVRLPFSSFVPVFRARTVAGAAPLDPSRISSLQLMLSKFEYDGALNPAWREGRFALPLASVTAYPREPVTPAVVLVSSAGVTRPNRPGINLEEEPPAVKLNDALGGILTYKLKGEDVVRGSGVPFAVVRPVALTEEPAGAELVLGQGDTMRGKVSREDVASLCAELLTLPGGTGRTFEIKSTVPFSQPFTVDPASPPPPRDWEALLESSGLRRGVTGKTINGRYTGCEPEAEAEALA